MLWWNNAERDVDASKLAMAGRLGSDNGSKRIACQFIDFFGGDQK